MGRYRPRRERKCEECGKNLPNWYNYGQKYCNQACKQRAYRKRVKIKKAEGKALKEANKIVTDLPATP